MSAQSFDRLLSQSRLAPQVKRRDVLAVRGQRKFSRADVDRLEGSLGKKLPRARSEKDPVQSLSKLLDRKAATHRQGGKFDAGMSYDLRQQVVVKIHYFNHAAGGGGALKAHAQYVARDAAQPEDRDAPVREPDRSERLHGAEEHAKAHADYLARCEKERSPFYDRNLEGVDGLSRAMDWAKSDRRHFRIILSPERGEHIHDLPAFTREVMARAEAQLGTKLSWVAVDHHDTGHVHTHLILRGRRANGQDLIIPKDFIKHGFRNIARDIATEWLGRRTPAQEREALQQQIDRYAPTRLDRIISLQLPQDRTMRLSAIKAFDGDVAVTRALKARARQLEGMGLAREVSRNVLAFDADWQERLRAMELHLDIRKRLVQKRQLDRELALQQKTRSAWKGLSR
jgi:type IV secretory pathway VirD2 relaxase